VTFPAFKADSRLAKRIALARTEAKKSLIPQQF
jgi:hypothetical protein